MKDNIDILIAEDETRLRQLYASWLENDGFDVHEAANGEQALNKWNDEIDVVILDRQMPDIDGDEVLEKARQKGHHAPVLMLTGVPAEVDVIGMEFDEYLTKPVSDDKLIEAVDRLLTISIIRERVREFVRVGVTIEELQRENTRSELQAHGDYQKLKQRFNQLQQEVQNVKDEFTLYEKRLLIKAQKKFDG